MYWLTTIKFDQKIPHEPFFANFRQNAIFPYSFLGLQSIKMLLNEDMEC
jgi:hypothetical protein